MHCLLPILLLLSGAYSALATEVGNVTYEQAIDGSRLVTVRYTLTGDTSFVSLSLSLDGGSTFRNLQQTAEGDLGMGIPPGEHTISVDLGALGEIASIDAQFRVAADATRLIRIPAGQFMMGEDSLNSPEHLVTLTRDFALGRTEVSNAEYLEALNWAQSQGLIEVENDVVTQHGAVLLQTFDANFDQHEIRYNRDTGHFYLHAGTYDAGSYGPGEAYPAGYLAANFPVMQLTWYGAACYCDWRSQMNGLPAYYNGNWDQTPVPDNPYEAVGFRLPTEAEWEFAAQHDDERIYPWGSAAPTCNRTNFFPSTFCTGWTRAVGTRPQGVNSLGLHDMAGNVYEWVNDWLGDYGTGPDTDPTGPASGSQRITRGGCWFSMENLSCAYRSWNDPSAISYLVGFRVCRTLH